MRTFEESYKNKPGFTLVYEDIRYFIERLIAMFIYTKQ